MLSKKFGSLDIVLLIKNNAKPNTYGMDKHQDFTVEVRVFTGGDWRLYKIQFQAVMVGKNVHIYIVAAQHFILYIKIVYLAAHHHKAAVMLFTNKITFPESFKLRQFIHKGKVINRHA